MTALLDTSFLFALTDKSDRNYGSVLNVIQTIDEPLMLPAVVLPEICYLIASRLGHRIMRTFLTELSNSNIRLEPISPTDLAPINEILAGYGESNLDGSIPILKKTKSLRLLGNRQQATGNREKSFSVVKKYFYKYGMLPISTL